MPEDRTILLSTTYLGPVNYFGDLLRAKIVIIEKEEHYLKQTYRNRCVIMTANGILPLMIPVIKVNGHHTKTKDILISYREKWPLNHWRAIFSAYRNAPFFEYYADAIERILFSEEEKLIDLNLKLTEMLLKMLKIEVPFSMTGRYETEPPCQVTDMRHHFSPKNKFNLDYPKYTQVFSNRHGFIPGLSIIDLLFNLGPDAKKYLHRLSKLNLRTEN